MVLDFQNLDKKDLQLLYYLDVDGRTPFSVLGKKTRLSKQVAKYRVERLEKKKVIKGYYAMIDTSRLGYTTFRVYLKFRNITNALKEKMLGYLKNQSSIWAVVLISGKWDIALGIAVKDIYEFYAVWDNFLKEYLQSINDYAISIYSPIYHYSKAYLLGKTDASPIRVLGGKERVDIDAIDYLILRELAKNARISLVDISMKAKLTAETIKVRLKNLEKKGVVQGYRAMIDVSKFGYEFYKAEIRLSDLDKMSSIMEYCHQHPNIYQVDRTIGGEILEIEFHVTSLKQMLSIIGEFEEQFPIERFDYITVLSEEKTTYLPQF